MRTRLRVASTCVIILFLFVAFSDNNRSNTQHIISKGVQHRDVKSLKDSVINAQIDTLLKRKEMFLKELSVTEKKIQDAKYISVIANKQKKKVEILEAKKDYECRGVDVVISEIPASELPVNLNPTKPLDTLKKKE